MNNKPENSGEHDLNSIETFEKNVSDLIARAKKADSIQVAQTYITNLSKLVEVRILFEKALLRMIAKQTKDASELLTFAKGLLPSTDIGD